VHVPDHASADENVLDAAQVRVLELVQHGDVVELDVEVLVDGFEGPADGDVVFELDGYCCGKGRGGGRRVSFVSYGGQWDFRTLCRVRRTVVCEGFEETSRMPFLSVRGRVWGGGGGA
jgi:hypothetical protein